MGIVTINNRNILALFLACFLLSSSLLITRARTEPDAAPAGGGDAKKEAPSVEPEPTPDAEPAQNSDGEAADGKAPAPGEEAADGKAPAPGEEEPAQGSASEEEGDQKEPKSAESEPEQDQGETTEQKEAREEEEMAEQDEEKKDPKKGEEKEKEEVEGRETIEEEEKKDDGGDDDDDDDPKGDEQQPGEDKKADPGAGGQGDQQKVDEKIDELCKAAKDPNLCFNSILAYVGNKQFPIEEINPDWVLKMQVNATIAQLVHIQTFIRDMLKQRPQDQILIKCKDAYFNFANELGNKAGAGDRAGLKTLATSGPKTLDTDCTSLVDAQPQATTPDIANTLKDVPTTSAPYLLNIAQLADTPKRKRK